MLTMFVTHPSGRVTPGSNELLLRMYYRASTSDIMVGGTISFDGMLGGACSSTSPPSSASRTASLLLTQSFWPGAIATAWVVASRSCEVVGKQVCFL